MINFDWDQSCNLYHLGIAYSFYYPVIEYRGPDTTNVQFKDKLIYAYKTGDKRYKFFVWRNGDWSKKRYEVRTEHCYPAQRLSRSLTPLQKDTILSWEAGEAILKITDVWSAGSLTIFTAKELMIVRHWQWANSYIIYQVAPEWKPFTFENDRLLQRIIEANLYE